MKLIFVRPATVRAALTCLLTWSAWSHVAIVDGDHVIDSMDPQGVRRRTLQSFIQANPRHLLVYAPCRDTEAGLAWARAQIGLPYDRRALWGLFLPGRRWDTGDAWYCAELAARALLEGGHGLAKLMQVWQVSRITPGRLRALLRTADQAVQTSAQRRADEGQP